MYEMIENKKAAEVEEEEEQINKPHMYGWWIFYYH